MAGIHHRSIDVIDDWRARTLEPPVLVVAVVHWIARELAESVDEVEAAARPADADALTFMEWASESEVLVRFYVHRDEAGTAISVEVIQLESLQDLLAGR